MYRIGDSATRKLDAETLRGGTEWMSQNDSAMIISFCLLDCSKKAHCPNSHSRLWGQTHDQSAPHAGHAKHRKPNSYAATASQCRLADSRAPN
jgi:hypothetical protein